MNEVQTRSFIKGLLHIRCYNIQDTISLPSLLHLIIPSLSDRCVLRIVNMKLRSNVPWSLDRARIRQLPVTLLDLNSFIIGLLPVCCQFMSCVELWLLQRVRMHRIGRSNRKEVFGIDNDTTLLHDSEGSVPALDFHVPNKLGLEPL